MIALLKTRCGCRKYINLVPWNHMHEIILPMSPEMGPGYSPMSRPAYMDPGVNERRFTYRKTKKFQGEEVAIYEERS